MSDSTNLLAKLELPKRWEILKGRANAAGIDPSMFVERVDTAALRVDQLLGRVRTGGGGLFEVFYGLSGSGKTTFIQTLPRFFNSVRVFSFPADQSIGALPGFVTASYVPGDQSTRILLIEKRDNPKAVDVGAVDEMLAELLDVFRTPEGNVLILWPITREHDARNIASKAWATGRDSMVDPKSKGFYHFVGLPKERYYPIADNTARNLTGDGAEAFGITSEVGQSLLPECETISDFFAAVNEKAEEQRGKSWSVLKERVHARLWVLLPGDEIASITSTALALTQGTRSRIDIDRIGEFVDRPDNTALYIADWRKRRASLAHLLRAIDVRLFPVPPNVALAAVRAFGESSLKTRLKQPSTNLEQAKNVMKASQFYKAILDAAGKTTQAFAGGRDLSDETSNEYRRIQTIASNDDTALNKALGLMLQACLADDAAELEIVAEKRSLPGSQLQPDVQVKLTPVDYICLEVTWRSTGEGIPEEIKKTQNTLTEAHIKKYVLEKATQFVRDLGL